MKKILLTLIALAGTLAVCAQDTDTSADNEWVSGKVTVGTITGTNDVFGNYTLVYNIETMEEYTLQIEETLTVDNVPESLTALVMIDGSYFDLHPESRSNTLSYVIDQRMPIEMGETCPIIFRFDYDGGTVTLDPINYSVGEEGDVNAAVTRLGIDNSTPVYYTLQGVRTANPHDGLYIVVKNGKATKQIIK